ncbi:hypothetical protein MFM001_46540 [Mycobacterium sp. MFM001]|nr:hypothetical protein MFM001_46540 [Mycobacterium sp. MFM001]
MALAKNKAELPWYVPKLFYQRGFQLTASPSINNNIDRGFLTTADTTNTAAALNALRALP